MQKARLKETRECRLTLVVIYTFQSLEIWNPSLDLVALAESRLRRDWIPTDCRVSRGSVRVGNNVTDIKQRSNANVSLLPY